MEARRDREGESFPACFKLPALGLNFLSRRPARASVVDFLVKQIDDNTYLRKTPLLIN